MSLARRAIPLFLIVGVVGGCYLPIMAAHIGHGDYPTHLRWAEDLSHGIVRIPQLFFHVLVAALLLVGAAPAAAGLTVIVALRMAAALAVFWLIRRHAPEGASYVAALLSILVLLVGPILPPGADRSLTMLGYFIPNALHNPTVIAAAAFVPLLIAIGAASTGLAAPPWRWTASAAVVLLAGLAKPHYVSCLLPAACASAAFRAWRGGVVPWRPLVFAVVVPSIAVLLWSASAYATLSEGGAATIAPLAVLGNYVPVDAGALVQRLASDIAFPLAVTALWASRTAHFPPMVIAWLAYLAGIGQALLLAETGSRMFDGNFIWSGQLATFGLMAAAAALLAHEQSEEGARWRAAIAWVVLIVHVASGVSWGWIRFQNA